MAGIYKIVNKINNKIYVGSTLKSFKIRFNAHVHLLRRNLHENSILQNAWNKYGENNFIFEIIESIDNIEPNQLLVLEQKYINRYNSLNRNYGYNICLVGKSRIGTKWSEESKLNRSGDKNPMYGKGYLRKGVLNPMYGKTLTQSHKNNMSKSLLGVKKPIIGILLSKPVIMLDKNNNILNTYLSCTEATNKTKILHISEVCNGKRKSAGGFIWKWK